MKLLLSKINYKELRMNRRLIPAVIVAGLVAAASSVTAANAAPPTDAGFGPISLGKVCTFDASVTATVTGKTKTITKPDGQRIITSPGQRITLFANGKTVSYVITGTRFERDVTINGAPAVEVKVTGRNILVNGPGTETPGIFLVVGNFDFALTPAPESAEVRGFNPNGPGQVIDVCKALS
jgi:hypothetical protein